MSQYIYKSIKYPIEIGLTVVGFPTFCGGSIISGVYVCSNSYPKQVFKNRRQQEWKDAPIKVRTAFLEKYYEWVQGALRELTDYISKGQGWAVKDNSSTYGIFMVETGEYKNGKPEEYKCTLSQANLSKGFVLIADAINGETNSHHSISTYSLAESDARWKPSIIGSLINPNSNRPTNVWVLAIPNKNPSNPYKVNITDGFNHVINTGMM